MAAGEGNSKDKHSKSTLLTQVHHNAGITLPFFPSNVASSTPCPYIWGGQTPQLTTEMEIKARNRKERASKIKRKGALQNTNVGCVQSGECVKVASRSGNHVTTTQRTPSDLPNRCRNLNINSVDSGNDGSSDAVVPNYDLVVPMPSIASILNMGIDLWNPSAECVEMSRNPCDSSYHRARDGREVKRQKRKQCNREAATRSRQRKQDEWEKKQAEVYALGIENHSLEDEIRMLLDKCNKLRSENDAIKDKIDKI